MSSQTENLLSNWKFRDKDLSLSPLIYILSDVLSNSQAKSKICKLAETIFDFDRWISSIRVSYLVLMTLFDLILIWIQTPYKIT